MSSPYTPSPSPFTIRLDPGDGDQPIEQFGMAIYVLLQLAEETPSWFCLSDARGGFVQIARRQEGYIVEWSWEGIGVRRRNRLAYVGTRSTKGTLVSRSKQKLFSLYEHSFVHLGDAFEILHDFWVGKPRPNRFQWFDHSKDLAQLNRIKKNTSKKGVSKVPAEAARVVKENNSPAPSLRSTAKVTSAPQTQEQIPSGKSAKSHKRGVYMLFDNNVNAEKIMETINIHTKKSDPLV